MPICLQETSIKLKTSKRSYRLATTTSIQDQSKHMVQDVLRTEKLNWPKFSFPEKKFPLGSHSVIHLSTTHTGNNGCTKDKKYLCAQWKSKGRVLDAYDNHRWDLPVLHYHEIMVIYPYPFLVVITLLLFWIIFINDCICILTGSPG